MQPRHLFACVSLMATYFASAPPVVLQAQNAASSSIDLLQIRPEVVMQNRDRLGLSDEQVKRIRGVVEKAGPKAEQLMRQRKVAMGKLAEMLAVDRIDGDAAMKQFDEVLAVEIKQRRLQMQVSIQLQNELNADQRKIAQQIQRQSTALGTSQELARKIQRVQRFAQQFAQSGGDVSEIQKLMQRVGPLIQHGQTDEAEDLLDQALKLSGDAPPVREPAGHKNKERKDGVEARLRPNVRSLKPMSFAQLESEVAALKKADVAWRKIAWNTCLLDGLKASRDQHKPIMLWIFIDRPIDDERC